MYNGPTKKLKIVLLCKNGFLLFLFSLRIDTDLYGANIQCIMVPVFGDKIILRRTVYVLRKYQKKNFGELEKKVHLPQTANDRYCHRLSSTNFTTDNY